MIGRLVERYLRHVTKKRLTRRPTTALIYTCLLGMKALARAFSGETIASISPEPLWTVESVSLVRIGTYPGNVLCSELVSFLTREFEEEEKVEDVLPEVEVEAEFLARVKRFNDLLYRDIELPFEIEGTGEGEPDLDLRLIEVLLALDEIPRSERGRYAKPFILVCFETLSDYLDVLGLRWSDVDTVRRKVRIKGRVHRISRALAYELRRIPRNGEEVFPISSVDVMRWERAVSEEVGRKFRFL
ncbi:hypothetical protein [Methanopyrus sp.]